MTDDSGNGSEGVWGAEAERLLGTEIGNFRLETVIGQGGMGTVFFATHHTLARKVAVKVLSAQLAQDRRLVDRFVDEARAVSEIGHPGLVQVYDFGRLASGELYSIMEWLEGSDLERAIAEGGKMSPARVASIGAQVAAAAAAAHLRGVVHRDLKPANIFLTDDGDGGERVVLLDFGIAKLLDREPGASPATREGQVVGTPEYIAPEQARGDASIDGRVDIYSLGCVLYEALAGAPPFRNASVPALLISHVQESPPPLGQVCPDVPTDLARAVMRCLEKDPEARFGAMDDVADALRSLASEGGGAAAGDQALGTRATEHAGRETPDVIAQAPTRSAPQTPAPTEVDAASPRDHRRKASIRIGIAGTAALAAGALLLLALGGDGEDDQAGEIDTAPEDETDGASLWEDDAFPEENPFSPEDDAAVGAGAALWQTQCAGCHGEEGGGDGEEAPADLEPRVFADTHTEPGALDRYRFEVIRRGVARDEEGYAMPPFEGDLSPTEVWQVVTFISTLELEEPEEAAPEEEVEVPDDLDRPERIQRGEELFAQRCTSCHGEDGSGDGEASRFLSRPPADLTDGIYKLRSTPSGSLPRDEDLFRTVTTGMGPVGMPSFSGLSPEERWSLVAYMKTLADRFEEEEPPDPIDIPERPEMDEESIATGRELYELAGCETCHGEDGRGDGPETGDLEDDRGDPIVPPDFASPDVFIGGSSPEAIYRTMMTGVDGTPMWAGRDFFSAEQGWDVVHYILSIGGGDRP